MFSKELKENYCSLEVCFLELFGKFLFGRFRFGGITAWLMWLFIHLLLLINFESRLVVMVRWAFSYFTHSRGSRVLISTGILRLPVTGAGNKDTPGTQA